MKTTKRPSYIVHWRDIETPVAPHGLGEMFGFASELAHASGMTHLRVAHLRIPPGLRAYPPVAMRDDEVFFIVLEGAPDFWADGYVHRLREGDGVWLNARTGIGHSVLNNCDADVCILAFTEGSGIHRARCIRWTKRPMKIWPVWASCGPIRQSANAGPMTGRPMRCAVRHRPRAHAKDAARFCNELARYSGRMRAAIPVAARNTALMRGSADARFRALVCIWKF